MLKHTLGFITLVLALTACSGGGGGDSDNDETNTTPETTTPPATNPTQTYQVLAFNDLGMHCMDREYSVYSILPPYNVLNVQVLRRGTRPQLQNASQVTVHYDAVADPAGSINSSSRAKTDFWQYADRLFDTTLNPGEGLQGFYMPADHPTAPGAQPLDYAADLNGFRADGIPITPLDDTNYVNPYPLLKVRVDDKSSGRTVATVDVVVPVAQETDCQNCHRGGQIATLGASLAWARDGDLEIQSKKNVLILHDHKHNTQLAQNTPVLCASCHYSAALDLSGSGPQARQTDKPTLSAAMHRHHGQLTDGGGNLLFPDTASEADTCYQCHPGKTTQCQRGAMRDGGMQCHDCHGGMSAVGDAGRRPWQDLPRCQSCHTGDALTYLSGPDLRPAQDGIRLQQAFRIGDSLATPIDAPDSRFAEQPDTLFRNSKGHGGLACEACHGSTHAIWPAKTNDNVAAQQLQGHSGTLIECDVCHTDLPLTQEGPHGLHNVNDPRWIDEDGHGKAYKQNPAACQACHGVDLRGSVLAKMPVTRVLDSEEGRVTLTAGQPVGCNHCHGLPR